ncbi:MAG: GntR family transcriptional regulator [Actinomycetota bacterium]|nr:GntR family transcriptional regulator [Actinomycetota bacterium]
MDRSSPLPLWAQLLEDLRERINAGEFAERFPTDKEMIEQYQVSRQTVREAVRRLEQDGVVVRRRGRGTNLTDKRFYQQLGTVYSLYRELEKMGHVQGSKILAQGTKHDGALAREFGVPEDHLFFHLERIRYADGEAVAIDRLVMPMKFAAALAEANFEHTGLYDELERRAGIVPTTGEERLTPVILSAEEASLLNCNEPTAGMRIQRTTYYGGEKLEKRETVVRGDRYCFVSVFDSSKNEQSSNITAAEYDARQP